MQIYESILDMIIAMTDCWQNTKNPLLKEYRSHIRKVMTLTIMSIFCLILTSISNSLSASALGLAIVIQHIHQGLVALTIFFLLATIWSCITFFLFMYKNGFTN